MNTQPKILAIYIAKGGSSKTTTAHCLAAELAARGLRVLAIDLDRQADLSRWCGHTDGHTLYDVAIGQASIVDTPKATATPGLDVIPANAALAGLEPVLRSKPGSETFLARQLRLLPARWDWIILDLPPGMGLVAINGLAAASAVMAPATLESLGIEGLRGFLADMAEASEAFPALRVLGIVATRADYRRAITREGLEMLRSELSEMIFETVIPADVKAAEAPGHGIPLRDYAPKARATQAYKSLAEEVIQRWQAD